jgi:hypothetical protein
MLLSGLVYVIRLITGEHVESSDARARSYSQSNFPTVQSAVSVSMNNQSISALNASLLVLGRMRWFDNL